MKKREIYEVYAKIVDANGAYNTLNGYPKAFDSRNYPITADHTADQSRKYLGNSLIYFQIEKISNNIYNSGLFNCEIRLFI